MLNIDEDDRELRATVIDIASGKLEADNRLLGLQESVSMTRSVLDTNLLTVTTKSSVVVVDFNHFHIEDLGNILKSKAVILDEKIPQINGLTKACATDQSLLLTDG